MNDFYINIAKTIGINCTAQVNDGHPSLSKIYERILGDQPELTLMIFFTAATSQTEPKEYK